MTGGLHGAGFGHLDRARVVRIETPEHVRIGFELADMGSRAAAVILDLAVLTMAGAVLILLFQALDVIATSDLVENLGVTALTLALFGVQWGYFFVAEGLFEGRTLGKRALGLRVIGAGGTPVTLQAAALRNLLRIVDLQPAGSSLIGLGLIASHPKAQRLGDIVAGTIVVRDRGAQELPEARSATVIPGRPRLDRKRFEVLERYVTRRDSLPPKARVPVRSSVARAMGPAISDHPRSGSTPLDDLLLELYEEELPRQSGGATGTSLQAVNLVRTQAPVWKRCRDLVDKASRRGLKGLTETEMEEFTVLYREVASDLARAHTYGGSLRLCFHLERLVGEAHNLFYQGGTGGFSLRVWLRTGFPRSLRRQRRKVWVATLLLLAPAAVTYTGVRGDPEIGRRLVPHGMITRAEEAADRLERGDPYVDIPSVQMSVFSSQIMTNNLQVAFVAAAGGVLAGVGTVLVLLLNGVHLGAVFALFDAHAAGSLLWVWVLPHGVLELTAIAVSGGAGLVLARAIVAPGRWSRARALQEAGRESLSLVAGAGVLLVLAGLVEGFLSPAAVDPTLKLSFAAVVAVVMVSYFAWPGRDSGSEEAPLLDLPVLGEDGSTGGGG